MTSRNRIRLATAAACLAALAIGAIVWPKFGVGAATVGLLLGGAVAVLQRPLRGIVFALLFFPAYPLFRALVVVLFPTDMPGLRFWPELVLMVTFTGLLLRSVVRRRRFAFRADDLPVALYGVLCGYGLTLSGLFQHPLFVVYGFHVVAMPALFYVAVRWYDPDEAERRMLQRAFVGSFVVLALPSFADYILRPGFMLPLAEAARPEVSEYAQKVDASVDRMEYWRTYARMQSLLFQENQWGTLCRFVSLLSLSWLTVDRRAIRGWLPLAGLSTLGLLLSVSRGSVAAWLVSVAVLLLLRRRYTWRLTTAAAAFFILVGAVFLYASTLPQVTYWIQMVEQIGFGTENFAADRTPQWRDGMRVFAENPSGTGIGTVGQAASATGRTMTMVADNNYVSIAAEMGIPGLLCLGLTLLAAFWVLGRNLSRAAETGQQALGMALVTFLAGACSHAVTANIFEFYYIMPIFWLFLAVFVGGSERSGSLTHPMPAGKITRSDVAAPGGAFDRTF